MAFTTSTLLCFLFTVGPLSVSGSFRGVDTLQSISTGGSFRGSTSTQLSRVSRELIQIVVSSSNASDLNFDMYQIEHIEMIKQQFHYLLENGKQFLGARDILCIRERNLFVSKRTFYTPFLQQLAMLQSINDSSVDACHLMMRGLLTYQFNPLAVHNRSSNRSDATYSYVSIPISNTKRPDTVSLLLVVFHENGIYNMRQITNNSDTVIPSLNWKDPRYGKRDDVLAIAVLLSEHKIRNILGDPMKNPNGFNFWINQKELQQMVLRAETMFMGLFMLKVWLFSMLIFSIFHPKRRFLNVWPIIPTMFGGAFFFMWSSYVLTYKFKYRDLFNFKEGILVPQ
eukprot:180116_1